MWCVADEGLTGLPGGLPAIQGALPDLLSPLDRIALKKTGGGGGQRGAGCVGVRM